MQTSYPDLKTLVKEKVRAVKLDKKDDILKGYFETKVPNAKKSMCNFFVRGSCIFTAEQCHFAHSPSDLIFEKPDLELFLKRLLEINEEKAKGNYEENIIGEFCHKKTKDQKWKEQPSLALEVSYKVLYDAQQKYIDSGDLKKFHTLDEVNSNFLIRKEIRELFQRELQQQLVNLFFAEYKADFLPKLFIEVCFLKVSWFSKFRAIVNSYCCYDFEHPVYGPSIKILPNDHDYNELIQINVIKIIKKYDLVDKTPIKSSVIFELYEKDIMKNDPFVPPMNFYLFRNKFQVDDLLQVLQRNEDFIKKFSTEFGLSEETVRSMEIFEHEKDMNVKQRDKLVEKYTAQEVIDGKSQLCRFFIRGLCIFDAKTCKFAHGTTDLDFKRVSIEEYEDKYCDGKKEEDYKIWEKNWADILREKQPSLNLEFSYKILFQYQFKSIEQNIMKESFAQQEIDADDTIRHKITVHMLEDETKQFVDFLFKTYNRKWLKRSFIDKCVQSVGWLTNWNRILDDQFCYEAKIPQHGFVVAKIPELEEFNKLIEGFIVKIIKDNSLLEHLPISSTTISKHFYKDIFPADPLMPTLGVYLKKTKLHIDDYLLSLHSNSNFISNLAKECNKTEEELKSLVLFDSTETELHNLIQKMKKILQELIEKSRIGFILFKRFEEAVQKKCTKEAARFSHNQGFMKKLMKGVAIITGVFIVDLLSEIYLFSLEKLKSFDYEETSKKYLTKLNTKCKKKEINQSICSHQPLLTHNENNENPEEEKTENEEDEVNMKKIKLVDDEESLEFARSYILKYDILAIDLEGILNKGGMIELIQIGCGEFIFILDFYKVKETPSLQPAFEKLLVFVKEIMESPKICKVLHDCRKDSLALHLFTHSCPVNVFDVSALHTLIEHLKIYKSFKNELLLLDNNKQEESKNNEQEMVKDKKSLEIAFQILACLDEIKAPGLNEVLQTYGASHGINHLKSAMKKKFEEMPRAYFLRRPLNKEYLIYSAKDVEDLVEVKKNIEEKLFSVLKEVIDINHKGTLELLCRKVSKTYSLFGCSI